MASSDHFDVDVDRVRVQFLYTEIGIGQVFAQIAKSSSAPEKRQRNLANAQEAYDTALRFLPRVPLTSEQYGAVAASLAELKAAIDDV